MNSSMLPRLVTLSVVAFYSEIDTELTFLPEKHTGASSHTLIPCSEILLREKTLVNFTVLCFSAKIVSKNVLICGGLYM